MTPLEKLFKKYMREHDEGKVHAKLAASSSDRWLGCPASIKLSDGRPNLQHPSGQRGTNTHTLLQFVLENPKWRALLFTKNKWAKAFLKHIEFDEEMFSNVETALKYISDERNRMKDVTGKWPEMYVERRVTLEGVGHGTSDCILYQPFGLLHVIDYKNGKYKVEPKDNTQGLYYAVAAADEFGWDFRECWITIIQPNAPHKKGPIRTWKTTPERLERANLMFQRGVEATKKKNPAVIPDHKYCYFCPARLDKCPAHKSQRQEKIMSRFERGL